MLYTKFFREFFTYNLKNSSAYVYNAQTKFNKSHIENVAQRVMNYKQQKEYLKNLEIIQKNQLSEFDQKIFQVKSDYAEGKISEEQACYKIDMIEFMEQIQKIKQNEFQFDQNYVQFMKLKLQNMDNQTQSKEYLDFIKQNQDFIKHKYYYL